MNDITTNLGPPMNVFEAAVFMRTIVHRSCARTVNGDSDTNRRNDEERKP
jgi:hypothetical protein